MIHVAAAAPGPPEVPQYVWDAIVGVVSAIVGWFTRKWFKK